MPDFTVDLEVRPVGAVRGTRELTAATKGLTEETRRSGEATRQARGAQAEIEASERRRRATLDDLARATRANNLALAQAKVDIAQYQRRLEAAAAAKRQVTQAASSLRSALFALQGAIAVLGLGRLVREGVELVTRFEAVERTFGIVLGSAGAAARELAFLRKEVDRLGLEFSKTSIAYSQFVAAAEGSLSLEQTRDLFVSVSEAMANLGINAQRQELALYALQQMASKGVVSMEELRRQLGDSLPRAFQIGAKAMGLTVAQFNKLVESGQLLSKDFLPKFAVELRKAFGTGGAAIENTQARLNRIKNSLVDIKREVGTGFLTGFMVGFADLKESLTDEELKAAARDLGESIGTALRTATDVALALTKHLETLKAILTIIVSLKVAAWFVSLAGAIATATGATLTFKAALSSLAIAGPLAAIGIALLAVIAVMEKYIRTTRLAWEAEMDKVARSQEIFGYYQTLKANKDGLTETEQKYAIEVRKTMEAERAALAVAIARAKADAIRYQFAPAANFAPSDAGRAERVKDLEREFQTVGNILNGLNKEWLRLDQLPTIKLPVDTGEVDGAAKKVQDLLTGFARAAEQAERIRDAQQRGGASEVGRETEEIERQNAAYQALHAIEGLSAASKARLGAVIEGLVGRAQDANRATAEGAAETQRSLAFTAAASEAEARLADAKGQTSFASREAAIQAEAEGIARENLKEGDSEYVAGLLRVIRVRHEYLAGIALEVAAIERQIAHASTLRQKTAEAADAQEQSTAATRRLAVELEAETEARARGIQIGSVWYQLLLAISATRAQEVAAVDQQTAAQRRLNDAQAAQGRARAEFTDWTRQREAAKEYGSEIAGILHGYGLLSEATRDLAIHEQALAIQREEGGARTIEQIEAELRGYAAMEETLARVAAAIELQAYIVEPVREAWARVGDTLQEALIDQLVEGRVNVEDLAKTILRTMLQALAEMLKRWILTHRAMQAEAMRTAAVNAAAAQAGNGGMGGAGGGAGSYAGLFQMAGKALGGGGTSAGGAGMGTAASLGAVVAIYAAVYFAASAWVKSHEEHIGEVTFKLNQDVGALVSSTYGNTARVKGLVKQIQDLGRQVVDWIASIGGAVEWVGALGDNALTIGRKGQGKNTQWFVELANGIKEWFASQEEAMSYAMVQAVRQATITGLDPIVLAAIKGSTAKTMDDFQRGLADAIKVASFGTAAATGEFRGVTAEMDRLRDSMRELIGTGAELNDALARINEQELLLRQSQRDAITGKQRTAEEEYQMRLLEARAWNAEREVRLQSITMQILEVKARIENYRATRVLIGGGGGGGAAGGDPGGGLIGLGRVVLMTAEAVATATTVIAGSGDAALDALHGYLASLQGLYDALAAMPPIDPSEVPYPTAGGAGRGSGGGGGDRKQGRLDLLEEVRSWNLTDVGRQLQDAGGWFDDFRDRLKDLGFSAAKQAELLAAARDELERRQKEIAATQVGVSRDFINAGTAAGGPLVKGLEDNKKTQLALIQANRDLQKEGLLSRREMRDLNREIHEAGVRQRDQMIGSATDQLFLDLYQLLGDEEAAAQLRFDLTLAELELRREELRLAMLAAGWTQERMDAVLGPLGDLIARVLAEGPALFGPGGGGGGSDSAGPSGKVWMHGRWMSSSEVAAEGTWLEKVKAAADLMKQYKDAGRNEYEIAVEKVETDFALIRASLGDTSEVAELFAAAMGRLRVQFLEGVQEFYDALAGGSASGLNVEQQYGTAMARYQQLLASVQGGDLSQANALAQAGQDLVSLAGQMWGTSTGGFAELREMILKELQEILGIDAGLSTSPEGLRGTDSSRDQTAAIERGAEQQVAATNRVSEVVDFSGRKIERILDRVATTLERIEAKEAALVVEPQTYGAAR